MNLYGSSSCSYASFAGHLASHSPAFLEAGEIWRALSDAKIDQAVALAIFHHESACGTTFHAAPVGIRFGNLRWRESYGQLPYIVRNDGGYCTYPTYLLATRHFAAHLRGEDGTGSYRGLTTVEQVLPVWAPTADGNDPDAYIRAVVSFVNAIGGGMQDVRSLIPRANWSIGTYTPKTSVTVHWNGPAVSDDADPLDVIKADAQFHIDKDWSTDEDPAPVHGDGVMYHRMYARDGRVFQTRDDDAVLWHCGASGNETSFAWQVMTGTGQQATPQQSASLTRDLAASGLPSKAHRDWSQTQCPGDELYALVHGGEELAFANDPEAQAFKNDTNNSIVAIKAELEHIHAKLDALGQVPVPPSRETLLDLATSTPAPLGYHWVGRQLIAN